MPEEWLLLDVTTECNLRCKHCHLWMTKEPEGSLSTLEKLRLVEEYAAWKPWGRVVFAGGEMFLKAEESLTLARKCRDLGLFSMGLSNGTLLNDSLIEQICLSGMGQLSISLDSPEPESYDHTRGVKGTFEKAVAAIKGLQKRKRELGSGPSIHVNTILSRSSIGQLAEHLNFLESLGAEGVFFLPLTETLANHGQNDPFFAKESLEPTAEFRAAIDFLVERKKRPNSLVVNGVPDLLLIRDYVHGTKSANQVCNSGDRNVVVDMWGNVRLCHHMEQKVSGGAALGNVRSAGLREICSSPWALEVKAVMRTCRSECEMNSCNRNTTCSASLS